MMTRYFFTVVSLLILSVEVTSENYMVPATAAVGENAEFYCYVHKRVTVDDYGTSYAWYRDDELLFEGGSLSYPKNPKNSSSRFNVMTFYTANFCPQSNISQSLYNATLDLVYSGFKLESRNELDCTTWKLTVKNVTADDYNATFKCNVSYRHRENRYDDYKSQSLSYYGKIVAPSSTQRISESIYYNYGNYERHDEYSNGDEHYKFYVGPFHCVANYNITWFISVDNNHTIIDIDAGWQRPDYNFKISEGHKDGLYESMLLVNRWGAFYNGPHKYNRFTYNYIFCGGSNATAAYTGKAGSLGGWYPNLWDVLSDRRELRSAVLITVSSLVLVAGICALVRAGVMSICYNSCCSRLAFYVAKHSGNHHPNVVYMPLGQSADNNVQNVENSVDGPESVILELDEDGGD